MPATKAIRKPEVAGPAAPAPLVQCRRGAHAESIHYGHVAVSDTHAYVADTVNRRVVRVKLGAITEATCAIP